MDRVGQRYRAARCWRLSEDAKWTPFDGPPATSSASEVEFVGSSRRLLFRRDDGLYLWDLNEPENVKRIITCNGPFAVSPSGEQVAYISERLHLLDLRTERLSHIINDRQEPPCCPTHPIVADTETWSGKRCV